MQICVVSGNDAVGAELQDAARDAQRGRDDPVRRLAGFTHIDEDDICSGDLAGEFGRDQLLPPRM
jgi:hypothetical protein